MVAVAHGCKCHVVLPDDAAIEKTQILEAMGAVVERVRPVSISHREHFVNVARQRALEAQAIVEGNPPPLQEFSYPWKRIHSGRRQM
jgi:cysteine synthase